VVARPDNRTLLMLLGGAVGALLLLNWYLVQGRVDISPVAAGTGQLEGPQSGAAEPTTALDKKPVTLFREIVIRPLFTPDRKPVTRDRSQPTDTAGPGDMRLVGVMKLDRQPARALIRMSGEASGKWITEGEQFGGWKLRQVLERSVVIEGNGRSHELTIQAARRQQDDTAAPGEKSR
jgi:hypothetical protein